MKQHPRWRALGAILIVCLASMGKDQFCMAYYNYPHHLLERYATHYGMDLNQVMNELGRDWFESEKAAYQPILGLHLVISRLFKGDLCRRMEACNVGLTYRDYVQWEDKLSLAYKDEVFYPMIIGFSHNDCVSYEEDGCTLRLQEPFKSWATQNVEEGRLLSDADDDD